MLLKHNTICCACFQNYVEPFAVHMRKCFILRLDSWLLPHGHHSLANLSNLVIGYCMRTGPGGWGQPCIHWRVSCLSTSGGTQLWSPGTIRPGNGGRTSRALGRGGSPCSRTGPSTRVRISLFSPSSRCFPFSLNPFCCYPCVLFTPVGVWSYVGGNNLFPFPLLLTSLSCVSPPPPLLPEFYVCGFCVLIILAAFVAVPNYVDASFCPANVL